jgi:hypothetical protein
MHLEGSSKLESFKTDVSRITYSDTKLQVLMLCMSAARVISAHSQIRFWSKRKIVTPTEVSS